jgi:hypothetical protein
MEVITAVRIIKGIQRKGPVKSNGSNRYVHCSVRERGPVDACRNSGVETTQIKFTYRRMNKITTVILIITVVPGRMVTVNAPPLKCN